MKISLLFFIQMLFFSWVFSQDLIQPTKNSISFYQSLYNFGGNEIKFSAKSNSLGYMHFFKNLGVGLDVNRIQMKKDGLNPIMPYEEWERKDNLQLYYANVLFSYRFVNFCPIKNLNVKIDVAPSFLIGGKNSYYSSSEGNKDSLITNTLWKSPTRMEYETKINVFGRLGLNYILFNRIEIGIAISTYLKFIAPTLMSLPYPFSPGLQQLNKSSFCSLSIKYNF